MKLGGIVGSILTSIFKSTPAAANRLLGALLTVAAIWWLGTELTEQSERNNALLVTALETQTRQIIDAVERITTERTREANIIKEVLLSVDSTKDQVQYLRGRIDELEGRTSRYRDVSMKNH